METNSRFYRYKTPAGGGSEYSERRIADLLFWVVIKSELTEADIPFPMQAEVGPPLIHPPGGEQLSPGTG